MPHITVEMLPGRTPEVKKAIAKEVMEQGSTPAKVPADSISRDHPRHCEGRLGSGSGRTEP